MSSDVNIVKKGFGSIIYNGDTKPKALVRMLIDVLISETLKGSIISVQFEKISPREAS